MTTECSAKFSDSTCSDSLTCRMLRHQQWGFRNEAYTDRFTADLALIIRGEIAMGNTDIITYVWRQYGWLADYDWPGVPEDEWSMIAQENAPNLTDALIHHCCQVWQCSATVTPCVSGLWLTTWRSVLRYGADVLHRYLIPPTAIVLSDLGRNGILIALSTEPPRPHRLPSTWHLKTPSYQLVLYGSPPKMTRRR